MKYTLRHNALFIFLVGYFSVSLNAQQTGKISGIVSDSITPIEFATVGIFRSNDSIHVVQATITDSAGHFSFDLPFDDYYLSIRMVGYLPQHVFIRLDGTNFNVTKNVLLDQDVSTLKGLEFVGQKELIKRTLNGFIIMTDQNIVQTGGTATDLLKNTPTVVVDAEEGITVRGKTPLILINGRNSKLADTDRIPASSVESIEIINNPSARYDADSEGGIIIITLKKGKQNGFNGTIAVGGGFGDRGRVNSSIILNYQKNKWNIGFSYDNRFAGRTRKIQANRTSYDLPNEYYLIQNRFDERFEQTQNFKLNIDFNPNKFNSLSFEAICNLEGIDNDESLTSTTRTQVDSFNFRNNRFSKERFRQTVAEFDLSYIHKFKKEGKQLFAEISSSFEFSRENTDISTQSLAENDSLIGSPFLQRTHNYQNSNVTNLRLDYVVPMSSKSMIELGYKGILRFTNADYQNLYFDSIDYIKNPLTSNTLNYNEQVHAFYLQYSGYASKTDVPQFKYEIGMRVEQVFGFGSSATNSSLINRQYMNFFPTATLAYFFNSNDFIKLSFSRRINRPALDQLNAFIDITDSLSQHGGNPNLRPELINAVELGYNKDWKKISFGVNAFFRYATDIIRNYIVLKSNGVALTTPINFGEAITYGVEGIGSFYPFKFWNINLSLSGYQQNINGSAEYSLTGSSVFSWYGKLVNNFTIWKGSKLQIIASYNSPIGTPQGQRVPVYYVDMGFQQKIKKGKWAIGLVATDVFNTQRGGYLASASNFNYSRSFKIDTRALMLTIAYSFGTTFKEEVLENKFKND